MVRTVFAALVLLSSSVISSDAGTYEYHPNSVLKLGGTFDSKNLTVAYPSCIRYDREYAIHRLDRKQALADPNPAPPDRSKAPSKSGTKAAAAPNAAPKSEVQTAPGNAEAPKSEVNSDGNQEEKLENVSANTDLSIEQIKTREHLYKFLNVSASISGQYKFFSASASVNYESEETFDSDSFVFGVRGMTTFADIGLINPRLSSDAQRLVADRQAFYARCGREWVSQETRGVMIAVVYTIKNVSQSQRSRLEAAVSGGFGSPVLKINVESKLTQIFQSAFVSNYYSARVHAIGGQGIEKFKDAITNIEEPAKVLATISDYMKGLNYDSSVPLRFTTGSLDQFLIEQRPELLFDTYNRRIADLYFAYEEYRDQRFRLWKFLNDDAQSAWDQSVDTRAWERLGLLDETIGRIEGKAQVCRKVSDMAADLALGTRTTGGRGANPAQERNREFLQDFNIGFSSSLALSAPEDYPKAFAARQILANQPPCVAKSKDAADVARSVLCECMRRDETIFVKDRFNITAVPNVDVVYDTESLKPRSVLYVSVTSASKLSSARIVGNDGQLVRDLRGSVDPNKGPIWFGSVLYRDGSGALPPADKLPYFVEIKDAYGRVFSKPIVPLN